MEIPTYIKDIYIKPNKDEKRQIWIDLAKGICILLVILNHILEDKFNVIFLQQIRMPLYFILSGLFFKDYGGFILFLKKKLNNILIPFLFFYFLSITIYSLYQTLLFHYIVYPDFGIILRERFFFNNAIWFLLCLFNVNLLFFIVQSLVKKGLLIFLTCCICATIGYLLSKYHIFLPFYFDSSLTALPFFYIGRYIIRGSFLFKSTYLSTTYLFSAGIVIIVLLLLPFIVGENYIRFVNNSISGNILIATICSCLGVFAILIICKYIIWLPIISYLGRYSIIILCVHMIFIKFLHTDTTTPLTYTIEFIIVVFLSLISIPLSRWLIPYFTAQKPLIK